MNERNIVLVGFMGSGKSMTANKLGKSLNKEVYSTDDLIETKEGRPISEIFAKEGEEYFRERERQAVIEVSSKKGAVIDCGGGVVLNSENISDLKKNGDIYYLKASVDSLYDQIKKESHRPLMQVHDPKKKVRDLLQEREPLYGQADHIIDADFKSIDEIADQILEYVK